MSNCPESSGLLVIPHIRVQNVNAISSSLTWGFPSITSFIGFMWNLERKIPGSWNLIFNSIGVVCHNFEPLIARYPYRPGRFSLTRNPLKPNGTPSSIVEEGRAHVEMTLILGSSGAVFDQEWRERKRITQALSEIMSTMHLAGGTILPESNQEQHDSSLIRLEQDSDKRVQQFRRLRRRLLPGFSLVSRQDLLETRFGELRAENNDMTKLDALLDLSRQNWRAKKAATETNSLDSEKRGAATWEFSRPEGWFVPIPVGYAALSETYPAGSVSNTRDSTTRFTFVESVYSLGQWIGPHHLTDVRQLLWYPESDLDEGLHCCYNDYSLEDQLLHD